MADDKKAKKSTPTQPTPPAPPAQKTAVTDPLEAAKIHAKPPPAPQPPKPEPVLFKPTGTVEPPKPRTLRFRVMETVKISLHGQVVQLNKDDVVSEAEYGPDGMARIHTSNVALVKLED